MSEARASEKKRSAWPFGLFWALFFLVAIEAFARWVWNPAIVDPALYSRIEPTYGYGYELAHPICRKEDDALACRPTQYVKLAGVQRLPLTKGEDALRFVTLGGSHAFGPGNFGVQLARILRSRCPSARVEHVNLSVGGTGTARHLVLLDEALRLEPDFILESPEGTNEYEDERDARVRASLRSGVWRLLLSSHAVVLGQKLLSERFGLERRAPTETADDERAASRVPGNLERWERAQRQNLAAMLERTRSANVPIVLVQRARFLPPDQRPEPAPGAVDRVARNRRILEELEADDVMVLDADTAFPSDGTRSRFFVGDRNHYSSFGTQRIAQGIAPWVLERVPAASRVCRAPNAATVSP